MNNNDWISIDEALPTHNCRVLVFKKGNAPYNDIVEVFYYNSDEKVFYNYYWSYYEEIAPTYWKYIYLPDGTEVL
jgi:hypothetical protein|uniref:DUF551 domain-containing protein n=1 Tax=Phage sp. ctGns7 TaxID=2828003 RepID=A0A8S5S996_9VIRU|nr:MAG TPA: Protein of unknown function (DUF551) [Phage sp. ctGns7]